MAKNVVSFTLAACELRRIGCIAFVGLALFSSGCNLLKSSSTERTLIIPTKDGQREEPFSLLLLQGTVLRFVDEYFATAAQVADDLALRVATPDARVEAAQWKVEQTTAAIGNAMDQNPITSTLDMVVLATLSRMVVEDYWVGVKYGDAALPMFENHRKLEESAWSLLNGWMTPAQQEELRGLIVEWRAKNPQQTHVAGTHFREFAEALGRRPKEEANRPQSLFSLLGLDPLAGLDPARQEIEKTRQLAERAIYYSERLPSLLRWQAELLTYQLAMQPETRQILTNANQLTQSAERISKTAEQLPSLPELRSFVDLVDATGEHLLTRIQYVALSLIASLLAATLLGAFIINRWIRR